MSYRIERNITIMAPPELVWATIQHVARRVEWDARIRSAELLTPLPIDKGARIRLSYRMYGMSTLIETTMIAWQPPHKSAIKGSIAGSNDTIAGSWQLVSNADGSTTSTAILVLRLHAHFAWLREQISGRATDRLTGLSQANAKRLIERDNRCRS